MLREPAFAHSRALPVIPAGSSVRVRNTLGSWASGFEVVSATPNGYVLRRLSDGSLLPMPIGAEEVRRD